eukprot:COSAG02_NODE_2427_length_8886_cov_8.409469_12_plen_88_part_00
MCKIHGLGSFLLLVCLVPLYQTYNMHAEELEAAALAADRFSLWLSATCRSAAKAVACAQKFVSNQRAAGRTSSVTKWPSGCTFARRG